MAKMRRYFAARHQPWVFWHQDIYSAGMAAEASRQLPKPAAVAAARVFARAECALVRDAQAVVAIGPAFVDQYHRWGVRTDHVSVIPNWAPLDELMPGRRNNAWTARQDLPPEPLRLMYAGTLGRKHNPLLLLELLDGCRARGIDAMLVLVSEGVGADDLAAAAQGRDDVRIMGYQSAEDLSDMLASADVLVALLEPDAAEFSVPSKVHSYLAAGRPIIALVPNGNPSAVDVGDAGGFVGGPDVAGAEEAASWLAGVSADPHLLNKLGQRARESAVERFDIHRVGAQFEELLHRATDPRRLDATLMGVRADANGGTG
jgi:glycosyltransferase involved in cell wall biosynthesis